MTKHNHGDTINHAGRISQADTIKHANRINHAAKLRPVPPSATCFSFRNLVSDVTPYTNFTMMDTSIAKELWYYIINAPPTKIFPVQCYISQ